MGLLASFATVSVAADKKGAQAVEQALNGTWRSADSKSRDVYRHPTEALAF